jgi:hypothetical protein
MEKKREHTHTHTHTHTKYSVPNWDAQKWKWGQMILSYADLIFSQILQWLETQKLQWRE